MLFNLSFANVVISRNEKILHDEILSNEFRNGGIFYLPRVAAASLFHVFMKSYGNEYAYGG